MDIVMEYNADTAKAPVQEELVVGQPPHLLHPPLHRLQPRPQLLPGQVAQVQVQVEQAG